MIAETKSDGSVVLLSESGAEDMLLMKFRSLKLLVYADSYRSENRDGDGYTYFLKIRLAPEEE